MQEKKVLISIILLQLFRMVTAKFRPLTGRNNQKHNMQHLT
jgi:hypothetical protein